MSRGRRKHDDAPRDSAITTSNNSPCSKFVMNSSTTNGRADLDMQRQAAARDAIGLKQWAGVVVH
jgi:hypothetical protein